MHKNKDAAMNFGKKISILLLMFLMNSSSVAMMKKIDGSTAQVVLSGLKVKVGTGLLAVTGAAATALVKGNELNLDNENILAIAGVGMVSAFGSYFCLNQLTPKKQAERYKKSIEEILKNKIFKKKEEVAKIFAIKDENKKNEELKKFVNTEYGKHATESSFATIGALKEANALEKTLKTEWTRAKAIDPEAYNTYQQTDEKIGEHTSNHLNAEGINIMALKAAREVVKTFRAAVLALPEHQNNINTKSNVDYTKVKQDQIGWNISAIVPLFVQPFAILFSILIPYLCQKYNIAI
jgi:hypothetical protein